jgi:hypothetical protein
VKFNADHKDASRLSPDVIKALSKLANAAKSNPGKPIDEAFCEFETRKARLRIEADAP